MCGLECFVCLYPYIISDWVSANAVLQYLFWMSSLLKYFPIGHLMQYFSVGCMPLRIWDVSQNGRFALFAAVGLLWTVLISFVIVFMARFKISKAKLLSGVVSSIIMLFGGESTEAQALDCIFPIVLVVPLQHQYV